MDASDRRRRTLTVAAAALSMACIMQAEVAVAAVGLIPGLVYHGVLLIALLEGCLLANDPGQRRIFMVLALLPLMRIVSLTVPSPAIPQALWYGMAGLPLFVAVALAARLVDLPWPARQPQRYGWAAEGCVALLGLPLSLAGFAIMRPPPLVAPREWPLWILAALMLVVFVGLLEELIFRHVLQQVLEECFGRLALALSSMLFASMYAGSLSPAYMLFMGGVGVLAGLWVRRSGSIWGVAAAHGLLCVGMLLVWPALA